MKPYSLNCNLLSISSSNRCEWNFVNDYDFQLHTPECVGTRRFIADRSLVDWVNIDQSVCCIRYKNNQLRRSNPHKLYFYYCLLLFTIDTHGYGKEDDNR